MNKENSLNIFFIRLRELHVKHIGECIVHFKYSTCTIVIIMINTVLKFCLDHVHHSLDLSGLFNYAYV